MSKLLGPDDCDCLCQGDTPIKMVQAVVCCRRCQICGRNICTGAFTQHKEQCGVSSAEREQVNLRDRRHCGAHVDGFDPDPLAFLAGVNVDELTGKKVRLLRRLVRILFGGK